MLLISKATTEGLYPYFLEMAHMGANIKFPVLSLLQEETYLDKIFCLGYGMNKTFDDLGEFERLVLDWKLNRREQDDKYRASRRYGQTITLSNHQSKVCELGIKLFLYIINDPELTPKQSGRVKWEMIKLLDELWTRLFGKSWEAVDIRRLKSVLLKNISN